MSEPRNGRHHASLNDLSLDELIKLHQEAVVILERKKARTARAFQKEFSDMADKAGLTSEEKRQLFG